jgi:murein DD-endopeptidase MepM/ murein hydrolase activator NlpD
LGEIADRNGTTVSEIMKANPSLKNPNQIAVGQQLQMPAKKAGGGAPTPSNPPANRPPATAPDAKPPGQTSAPPSPQAQPTSTLIFPLWVKPGASWKDGPRYFGCPRSGGRKHGGCDLYAPFGAKIRAIADGIIVQQPYPFYDGTDALEVYHKGVGVVRYGEISSSKRVSVKSGQKVKVGEHIAYVGLLDSLQMSMIHFELFGEQAYGQSLSGGGVYRRNPALKDPTPLIDKLYKLTFG